MSLRSYKDANNHFRMLSKELLLDMPQDVSLFYQHFDGSILPKTMYGYLIDLRDFMSYFVQNNPSLSQLSDVDSTYLNNLSLWDFNEYMADVRLRDIQESAQCRKLAAIRKYLTFLLKNVDFGFSNVAFLNIETPKKKGRKTVTRMTNDEAKAFLDNVEFGTRLRKEELPYHERLQIRDIAILSLMLNTGIRVSECVGLDLGDVELKYNRVFLLRKGFNEEYVYFPDTTKEYLRTYLEKRRKMTGINPGHEQALFISRKHNRISDDAVRNLVRKYAATTVPEKHITAHKLRATYGTALYSQTHDIYAVQQVLGHSSVETSKIYIDDSEANKEKLGKQDLF